MTQPYIIHDDYILEMMSLVSGLKCRDNIQLMTFHEVNTRIDQPMEMIFRGRLGRGEYHVPRVDHSLYSPKLKVINCFII